MIEAQSRFDRRVLALLLLSVILAVGAYFRFTGLNWDGSYHLHPDERFLTEVANLLKPTYDPLLYLQTSQSPLNPHNVGKTFYVYGNFPMTFTRYFAEAVNKVCIFVENPCAYNYTFYDGIHLVGRALSAFVDLLTVALTFFIGRRLYNWRVGLLAAVLQAAAVMPIQQAHFFTMDNWAAFLTTAAMYAAVRASEASGQKRWWALFGLGLGLAVASRINVAPLALMAPVAAVIWLSRRDIPAERLYNAHVERAILGVMVAAAVSLVTFRLAQPYAFADAAIARQTALSETGQETGLLRLALQSTIGLNPLWLANIEEIQRLQSPDAAFPPALQWTDRAPLLFPLTNMVLYGMGLAAGIVAWVGFVWALWRIARARPDWTAHALPVAWAGLYFLFAGTRWVKSVRYFLPIYPFLFLLGAWALFEVVRRARGRPLRLIPAVALIGVVVASSLLWANAFVDIYRRPVTRVAASAWIFDHVQSGATLLYEVAAPDGRTVQRELQLPLREFQFTPGGAEAFIPFTLPENGTITAARFNYLSDPAGSTVGHVPYVTYVGDEVVGHVSNVTLRLGIDGGYGQPQALGGAEIPLSLTAERQAVVVDLPDMDLAGGASHMLVASAGEGGAFAAGTSILLNEHWDDPLPLRYEGRDPFSQYYTGVSDPTMDVNGIIPITNPDSEEKRQGFYRWLDQADTIVLSSQRALWSVPRLPLTYPLTTRYYDALFSGELGFDVAAQFHADLDIGPARVSDTGGEVGWGALPEIGWPPPNELAAEEAFSVYDHPPVWIFVKRADYDPGRVRQVLDGVDLSQVVVMNPGQATRAPNGLMLPEAEWARQRQGGTFAEVFDVDGLLSRQPALAAVVWWLAVVALGWLTFPLCLVVFRGLPDRGYGLSRILALLLISYFGWIVASVKLLPHTRATLLVGLGLLAAGNVALGLRRRPELLTFVKHHRKYIAFVEVFAALLYLFFILVRLGNPDVWDVIWGGEKPMDLSYFTAVLKSTTFPPYDPWFAGGYINYYYYGFVYVGALTKLLGLVPTVAYNLILPMLFSFTGLGAFTVTYNLVAHGARRDGRRPVSPLNGGWRQRLSGFAIQYPAYAAGLAAAGLCVLLGNLAEVGLLLNVWQRASDSAINTGLAAVDTLWRTIDGGLDMTLGGQPAPIYPGDWFWTATRAINANPGEVAPITEFPFFTFLYGDLHAHMMALPLTLLALGWAVALALQGNRDWRLEIGPWSLVGGRRSAVALQFFVGGLAIGALRATNTWDWPTYLLIGVMAVGYAAVRRNGRLTLAMMGEASVGAVALVVISTITFLPFTANYGVGYTSFSLWPGSYTYLGNYLAIYGLFLFLVLTHLGRELRAWSATWTTEALARLQPLATPLLVALFLFPLLTLGMMLKGYWIAPVVLTLAMAAGLLALRPGLADERRIVLFLSAMALALTLMVEMIVLDGDVGRMNTVFKFYMQVWVILSIVGGAALAWAWPAVRQSWGRTSRQVWQVALVVLVGAAALYPILATRAKWATRMNQDAPHTLDGMAFMPVTQYGDKGQNIPLHFDYDAVRWMQQNIEGSPVIAEAFGDNPYRSIANRVAMYTGLPAIVGWDWHQRQQRAVIPGSAVQNRIQDVNTLYNTVNAEEAATILEKYDVGYIYVGQLEWVYYSPQGLLKFDQMANEGRLRPVYRSDGVTIFEVVG